MLGITSLFYNARAAHQIASFVLSPFRVVPDLSNVTFVEKVIDNVDLFFHSLHTIESTSY